MLADVDPFSLGSINISLDKTFSSDVKEAAADVMFYPRENAVALEFKQGVMQYRQFWDETGRRKFIKTSKKYIEDFANQNLVTKYNKSRAIYGNVTGRFQWKTMAFSPTYGASPVIQLGYRFRDGSPYFAVYQKKAGEETGTNSKGVSESPSFSVYFTRAQSEELAGLFDQAFLLETLNRENAPPSADSGKDVYIAK